MPHWWIRWKMCKDKASLQSQRPTPSPVSKLCLGINPSGWTGAKVTALRVSWRVFLIGHFFISGEVGGAAEVSPWWGPRLAKEQHRHCDWWAQFNVAWNGFQSVLYVLCILFPCAPCTVHRHDFKPWWLMTRFISYLFWLTGPRFCVAFEALGKRQYTSSDVHTVLNDIVGKSDEELSSKAFCQGLWAGTRGGYLYILYAVFRVVSCDPELWRPLAIDLDCWSTALGPLQTALFIDRRLARASRVHFTKDCLVTGGNGALWDCRSALLQCHRVLSWLVDQRRFFRLRPPQAMRSSAFDQSELKKLCRLTGWPDHWVLCIRTWICLVMKVW